MNNKIYFWLIVMIIISLIGLNNFFTISPKTADAGCATFYLKSDITPNPSCGTGTQLGTPQRTSVASSYGGVSTYIVLCASAS